MIKARNVCQMFIFTYIVNRFMMSPRMYLNVRIHVNVHALMTLLNFAFSERSESYQHLYNYRKIPELFSLDSFHKSQFFVENHKSRSHTHLTTPKAVARGE